MFYSINDFINIIFTIDRNFDDVKYNIKNLKKFIDDSGTDQSLILNINDDIHTAITHGICGTRYNFLNLYDSDTELKKKLYLCLNDLNNSIIDYEKSMKEFDRMISSDPESTKGYRNIYKTYRELFDLYRSSMYYQNLTITKYIEKSKGICK